MDKPIKPNNGHGGARPGSGYTKQISEGRVLSMRAQGMAIRKIGERLGVSDGPVRRVIKDLKARGLL